MPAQTTYTPIATQTLTGYANVTFNSIPQTYTDLILVAYSNTQQAGAIADVARLVLNAGTTNGYNTILTGNGSSATSTRETANTTGIYLGIRTAYVANLYGSYIAHIFNYSNTTTFKSIISRAASDTNGGGQTQLISGTWASTAAVTSLAFAGTGNYPGVGTMVTLYGIAAA